MRKCEEIVNPNSCLNKAKDDEMIFVVLGRDPAAMATIIEWCNERIKLGLNDEGDTKLSEALECANKMVEERADNPSSQLRKRARPR